MIFCDKARCWNHNNRILFIIMHKWEFSTNCDHIAHTTFGTICKQPTYRMHHQRHDLKLLTRSTVIEYFSSKIQDVLTYEEIFILENFVRRGTIQKHFQIPRWDGYKNEVMNWEQTHNRTRPKVAFCILKILLTYRRDFLTELFLKNVVSGARVCPPLGAGE